MQHNFRSSTIRNVYDIDIEALRRGEPLNQMFDPWQISEKELREFVGTHVKKMGNKRPFITFSRRNRCHVNNHIYCDPIDNFSHRERVKRDERYKIVEDGFYEYHVEQAERMSLPEVRLRIGSWIKRNCCQVYRTSYNQSTHVMTFYNPLFDPDEKERQIREREEEIERIMSESGLD